MTTAMATPQDLHDRLQTPEDTVYSAAWTEQTQEEANENSPYYNLPKRNKRKNFKPRCAPNATNFSDDSNQEKRDENAEDRASPDRNGSEDSYKIGVKNFSKEGRSQKGAVDLSRRLSTDSNDNEGYKKKDFQRSYIDSLQIERDQTVVNLEYQNAKSFCAKNPFAISQLIKTNSPPRRRDSVGSDDAKIPQDINANERLSNEEMDEDSPQNGDQSNANKVLRDYAMNTMKELLGIYGLSSSEVSDVISGQPRALEALQGKPLSQLALGLKRRHSAERRSSATDDEGSTNITPPRTPDEAEQQRQRAIQILTTQSMRLFGRDAGYGGGGRGGGGGGGGEDDSSCSDDGEHTLDLSLGREADMQDVSRSSSTAGSEWETVRRHLEEAAPHQPGGYDRDEQCSAGGLISALSQLEQARKAAGSTAPVDYSRYVKRYGSSLDCGSSYCKDLGYREHFHCLDCAGKIFCKKEEMIRHFKWHKKRDESLAHGFMRYSPLDDCAERYADCPHNRSQTHYHCIQDACDKVYISTSDVQMHANYHRKDSAILQEGFQRFRATETCSASHCAFQGQRTTHFHCRRPGCTYTFKNKADMEKHKTYHIKDEALARDGFKKYMKNEPCPYKECRFSRTCNHIHCIRPRCNYVLHSSSQIFTHKRKHERKEQEMGFGLPTSVIQSAFLQASDMNYSPGSSQEDDSLQAFMMEGDSYPGAFSQMVVEEVSRKYIEAFSGGKDAEDKCARCSAFNKHYHCLAEGCAMAHSCQSTMVKHALEHEAQAQVVDGFFLSYGKSNPCPASGCRHIRDLAHSHCTWENCGQVIIPSEDQPFKRLEHHRQHAISHPLSPNLASRLAPSLVSQLSAQLHPNVAAQLSQAVPNLPPNLAQLAQMAPNLSTPNLQAQLGLGPSPVALPTPMMINPTSSLDEMFSRKRGRPPKNRVVEVWTDNVNVTPQAIFTSFKLPKSNQPSMSSSPVLSSAEEFSMIKFQNFTVFTIPESCGQAYPSCPFKNARLHLHCAHCIFSGETHAIVETHARETHNIYPILDGFDFYSSFEHCGGKSCFKNQLRTHFHCIQGNGCPAVLTQYSAISTHKHGRGTPIKDDDEARDYSTKERDSDSAGSSKNESGEYPTNFSIKNEFDKDVDGALNVSVVKATGTFYPSSHLKSNTSSPSPRSLNDSPCKDLKSLRIDFPKTETPKPTGPTIPPSCHDQLCPLNKTSGCMNLHYHCPHCNQAYMDLKLLFGHMMKKHSNMHESPTAGLAATKETLEREYPEISILPSTATSSGINPASPTQRQPNPSDQVQAVQSLLLQQYLSGGVAGGLPRGLPAVAAPPLALQDQLKLQQYTASLAAMPPHLQMAILSQGGSPFLYPPMLYPPELLMETGLLSHAPLPADKEAEMIIKKATSTRAPHMRILKDEPIPEGYLRFRFNEDCAYQHCGYREHQTHFHCTRKDCGYSFCDKTRFVQHTARHERLDTLMGGDFQQYRANVYCNRPDCAHASNFGSTQNKASHFHCLKCDFVCTDTNKVVAHRRQHQKMDSIQAAGFDKFPPSKGCGFEPQCVHSKKQTHYHCLQCGFAVLGLSQMTSHKYKHQEAAMGPSTSSGN